MCGIAGFFGQGDRTDLARMTRALAHRGPDGEASARRLAVRLEAQGVAAEAVFPCEPHGDWNEAAVARQAAGRRRLL